MRPFISLCYQFPEGLVSFWCFSCFSLFNLQGTNRFISGTITVYQVCHRLSSTFLNFFCRPTRHTSVCTLCCHSHNVLCKLSIRKTVAWTVILMCRHYLSSRAVASQVLWAEMSLTTVFGMGTGGPSS